MDPYSLISAGWAVAILSALIVIVAWDPIGRWKLRKIPGPWSLPFLGHLPAIAASDLTLFLHSVARKYGHVAQVRFGAKPWVLVSDPAAIRKIAYKCPARPEGASAFVHMLVGEQGALDAEGILYTSGPSWKAARRAFESSIMHPDKLASHIPGLQRCLQRFMAHLKPYAASGEALEMGKAFGNCTLAMTGEAAYGVDFWPPDEQQSRGEGGGDYKAVVAELRTACRLCFDCLEIENATAYLPLQIFFPSLIPLWRWLAEHLPDAKQTRHMRARQTLTEASRRLIHQYYAAKGVSLGSEKNAIGAMNGDAKEGASANGPAAAPGGFRETSGGISSSSFLAAMLEERQRPSSAAELEVPRMNDMQVIAQAVTFILGGFETTSTTLSYTTFLLASNPEAQSKLRAELLAHPGCLEDFDVLMQLPYLDAVIQESQRLYPVGTYLLRELPTDVDLGGGMVIPRGVAACLFNYGTQRDPSQWTQPERFLPERFLPETKGALGPADPSAHVPFGLGTRMCVGYKLAKMMLKSVLAALLLRYRVELHPRQKLPLEIKTGLTMAPRDGVWVTLSEVA